ncbi:MAG: hypothetical protein Q8P58_03015 [Candidatus Adlerbacteria bacterium]|nr:hypothetical protein [Candidatus Adlerbacteria bacterium]
MKKTFTKTLIAVLGGLLLVPALTFAQTSTPVRPTTFGTELKANLTASTTRERPKVNASLATSTAMQARLQRAMDHAHDEIDRRVRILQGLLERILFMKRVSENFKGDLRTTVETQIQSIEALRARIASSTDITSLRDDLQSIGNSYRVFSLVMLKAQIAAAGDRIVTMTATMSEIGAKLKARIDAAAGDGEDVSALSAALASLAAHIDSANAHAQAAVNGTATLESDNGDQPLAETNRAAFQAAREELRLAHEEVKAGRENIRTIIDGLKAFSTTTETSVDTSGGAE